MAKAQIQEMGPNDFRLWVNDSKLGLAMTSSAVAKALGISKKKLVQIGTNFGIIDNCKAYQFPSQSQAEDFARYLGLDIEAPRMIW